MSFDKNTFMNRFLRLRVLDRQLELLNELDKGIDDMENGRVTPHEETMKILIQRYNEYVSNFDMNYSDKRINS